MISQEILRQVRRLHLRARRVVEDVLGGEYHSVFKGAGIAFEEVREYQPGDDVRAIDWNVTARLGQPFVKRFIEERELTLVLLVDVSGSQDFGSQGRCKREVAAELAAVLALSAASNNDRVALLCVSDRIERFVPPRKGTRHVLRLLRELLVCQPVSRHTSLAAGLHFLNKVLRRRTVVFLLSDFFDEGYEPAFRRASRRHDLIAVRISDLREQRFPAVGLIWLKDAETDQLLLLHTSAESLRQELARRAVQRRQYLQQLARASQVDLVEVATDGSHLDSLIRFFRQRERRVQRT